MGKTNKNVPSQKPKRQATLFQFEGFSSAPQPNNEVQNIEANQPKKYFCTFCGNSFSHDGALQMHSHWCKENPERKKTAKPEEPSKTVAKVDPKPIVQPILNAPLFDKCKKKSSNEVPKKLKEESVKISYDIYKIPN